jgi:hypothetical protein
MSATTIGIQVIMPKTGTSPQQIPQPQPESDRDSDHATMIAEAVAKQAPPPPGMGKLVDKTV